MSIFKLSWKYLMAKPLSTGLNILLLALGLSIITVLLLIEDQFENKMSRDAAGIDLVIGAKGSPLQLVLSSVYHIDFPTGNIPLDEASAVSRNRLIKSAIPMGLGDNYEGFRIVGSNHEYLELYNVNFSSGKAWAKPFEVVLGSKVAKEKGFKVGDTFIGSHGIASASHEHDEHPYVIVGVLAPANNVIDELILTSIESIWYSHDDAYDHEKLEQEVAIKGFPKTDEPREITTVLVAYRNPIAAVQLPRMVNARSSLQAASPSFEIARLYELLGIGISLIQGLALVIIFIAGLGIFIALFNSLKERKYDLAVMRAIGAAKSQLFLMILLEGVMLTFIGAVLGLFLGHLFIYLLVVINEQGVISGLTAFAFVEKEWWIIAYSLLVGLLASIIPAWNAYRTDIAGQLTR
ncbi:ABC transporter permease [Cyclobacterium qasimii]|uniref:ABC-type antimicrobial peptide transport system, permease component n=2 Tax=Cyclobacterium qasimii TaxID=1350429 RepID=S7WX94_9BACT|nr:FtsX-like permease family protein [Cyclobacterium qasimii]EPR68598.1 ABC-type antimicrobial peptide transport system, permease component [Cyclobacterium qasimii M12-11B]GEO20612.1 peptide ABC transporter permease [Cyclobacterium qasimii]